MSEYYNYDPVTKETSLKTSLELPAYISQLNTLYNTVRREMEKNPDFKDMVNSLKVGRGLATESEYATYGALNMFEFVSEIFGNRGFQEALDKIKYPNSNESLLDRFKKIIKNFLNSLGLKVEGTALSEGLASIMDLLNAPKIAVQVEVSDITEQFVDPLEQFERLGNMIEDVNPDLGFIEGTEGEQEALLTPQSEPFSKLDKETKKFLNENGIFEADYESLSLQEKEHLLYQTKNCR